MISTQRSSPFLLATAPIRQPPRPQRPSLLAFRPPNNLLSQQGISQSLSFRHHKAAAPPFRLNTFIVARLRVSFNRIRSPCSRLFNSFSSLAYTTINHTNPPVLISLNPVFVFAFRIGHLQCSSLFHYLLVISHAVLFCLAMWLPALYVSAI